MDDLINCLLAAYVMQVFLCVTDFEMQMIKLDESAEQLKEATQVTLSRVSCVKLFEYQVVVA